jgi:tetratricopeptide (TPR) repeat protein
MFANGDTEDAKKLIEHTLNKINNFNDKQNSYDELGVWFEADDLLKIANLLFKLEEEEQGQTIYQDVLAGIEQMDNEDEKENDKEDAIHSISFKLIDMGKLHKALSFIDRIKNDYQKDDVLNNFAEAAVQHKEFGLCTNYLFDRKLSSRNSFKVVPLWREELVQKISESSHQDAAAAFKHLRKSFYLYPFFNKLAVHGVVQLICAHIHSGNMDTLSRITEECRELGFDNVFIDTDPGMKNV